MIKVCRCGKEYEAGIGMILLPVCPECAAAWDAEIDAKIPKEVDAVDADLGFDKLGIRPRHYACTFDTFTPRDENERRTVEYCKRMASSRRGLIALIGNNGTGKTHLMCASAREIGAGKIFKMIEVGMFIREGFGDNHSGKTEQGQLDALVRLPFLGIDEADKSKRTENEMNWLSYIIDERLERYRPTILVANAHPKASHEGALCERCFESIMTPDVLDRFSQFGVIQYFSGSSHRRDLRGKE